MDKSLKVGEHEWRKRKRERERERERRGTKFMPQMRSEFWSVIFQMIKVEKCTHKASIYSLNVTQNWREIWISIQMSLEFVEPNLEPKFNEIWLVNFSYGSAHLIQDQVQDSPLSVPRCHEACKAWRTCTKCDYMIWQWGVSSKCSPPP